MLKEHFPCRFTTGAQQIELSEVYEGAIEKGCSFCSILLEAARVMLGEDPPYDSQLEIRYDRDQGLNVTLMVNDDRHQLELFRKSEYV